MLLLFREESSVRHLLYVVPSTLTFLQSLLLVMRWRGMGPGWGGRGEVLVVVGGGRAVVCRSLSGDGVVVGGWFRVGRV